jgi:hypothetical protein
MQCALFKPDIHHIVLSLLKVLHPFDLIDVDPEQMLSEG